VRQVDHDLVVEARRPWCRPDFHNTLVAATAESVRLLCQQHGKHPVVSAAAASKKPRLTNR